MNALKEIADSKETGVPSAKSWRTGWSINRVDELIGLPPLDLEGSIDRT